MARSIHCLIAATALLSAAHAYSQQQPQQRPYEIRLLGRTFIPEPGVSLPLRQQMLKMETPRVHTILQFQRDLTVEDHRQLAARGIILQGYIGGRAYHASVPSATSLTAEPFAKTLRHASRLQPRDKIKGDLAQRRYQSWALDKATGTLKVLVEFFPDVTVPAIRAALAQVEASGEPDGAVHSWGIQIREDRVLRLADMDIVKTLQQGPTPFLPLNRGGRRLATTDGAQLATFVNPQPGFQALSGQGIRIGICDSGIDQAHNDFSTITAAGAAGVSRVYNARAGSGGHGTHVASIAGGNGLNSANNGLPAFSLSGQAPQAMLGDYPQFGSDENAYYGAIVNDTTFVTNHSYVQTATSFYDTGAADIDRIVRGDAVDSNSRAIPARPQVWAAGNNGLAAQYGNEEGYYSVFTSAKNTISVGSLDTFDGRSSDFSSIGPTFDGRIKPDIAAPGCNDSIAGPSVGIQAAQSGTQGYIGMCGTSMAAPVVAGVVALMAEQHQTTYGTAPGNMRPSTYKAILVQTAEDREKTTAHPDREFNNPDTGRPLRYHAGPDFITGYGLVNANGARQLMADASRWREGSLAAAGDSRTFCISVARGAEQVKVTLAWDDEPGDTTTAETAAKLVNDLDLTLTEPGTGTVYRPWTLDPLPLTANPGDGARDPITDTDVRPAYRGIDRRNNVEMASVFLPREGLWRARVRARALPNGNMQRFSIATSHPIAPPWVCHRPLKLCEVYPKLCTIDRPWIQFKDKQIIVDPRTPIPIDRICPYVINCPGCEGRGWEYCPGWRMDFAKLPADVVVSLVDDQGKVLSRDDGAKPDRSISIARLRARDQHFLIFTDRNGAPYANPVAFEAKVTKLAQK